MTEDHHPSILIVDDDPAALKLLERHLVAGGRKVLSATNGTEALRAIVTHAPPIVITDWAMPEMDGLELCRAIRDHELIGFIYLIILTAHADKDRIVTAFEAGADDYLTKPFHSKELLARLRAGERIVQLQDDVEKRTREVHRANAEMAIAAGKLEEANELLTRLATTDELTGLLNRREAMRRLDEQWRVSKREQAPLACIGLDIDHFKSFNDTQGHAFGDLVLKETARVLKSTVRAGTSVCRVGGEEFLIICPNTTNEGAVQAAERLRSAVEQHRITDGNTEVGINISLGVAERTGAMSKPDDVLKAADDALYVAKRTGRNRVCVAGEDTEDADHTENEEQTASAVVT